MLQSKTTPNSQWLKTTKVFFALAVCPLKVNYSLCSMSSYHFHSGTQSLFGMLLAPKQLENNSGYLLFFFFFFFNTESLGRFLFILCFFFVGELFWLHPEAFVVFVQPGFRLTLPALEGQSQPSNQQRSLWRVLNFCSFLATANYMAHPTWDRGQKMQWE